MDKDLNLLYFSATGNTLSIVKSIASTLADDFNDYNVTLEKNRTCGINFTDKDLVIVGVPVYAGRVPKFLVDYFSKVKGNNTPAVFVVTYGNRDYEDSLLELKDIFEGNGFISVAAAVFVGEHSYTNLLAGNRPNESDLKIAKELGLSISNKLKSIYDTICIDKLKVPGNFPYVVKPTSMPPLAPKTSNDCIQCGLCYKNCPTYAIDLDDYKNTDINKCIKCFKCIKECPVNAREFVHPALLKMKDMLISNFSNVNREPEIYI